MKGIAVAVAALVLGLLAVTPPSAAEAAPRIASATVVSTGNAGKFSRTCAAEVRKATRLMPTATAAERRRKATRARKVGRRCAAAARKRARPMTSSVRPSTQLTIGIDGGHDEWWSDTINARAELGASVTRHEWDPPFEAPDAKDEFVYTAASEVQTRIHALLGGNDLGDPAHYQSWVLAFVARYGPGGSFWAEHPELDAGRYAITSIELGNEPYFGEMSPTEYAATVRPLLESLASANPGVKVILPSYIHGSRTTWIDTLYAQIPNLNDLFYAFADHPYWYGHHPATEGDSGPFDRLDMLRERMAHHGAGAKPIYITEYGESTASCGEECVTEAVQAEHLQAMLAAVTSRPDWGVELLSLFQLHDWATASTNREQQFGLLRHDGTPKPSYAIVEAAVEAYRG
jgi:hypothetical protein